MPASTPLNPLSAHRCRAGPTARPMSSAKGASDAASQHKILNVIEQDLRSLATNANRKFPEVKDAVERCAHASPPIGGKLGAEVADSEMKEGTVGQRKDQ